MRSYPLISWLGYLNMPREQRRRETKSAVTFLLYWRTVGVIPWVCFQFGFPCSLSLTWLCWSLWALLRPYFYFPSLLLNIPHRSSVRQAFPFLYLRISFIFRKLISVFCPYSFLVFHFISKISPMKNTMNRKIWDLTANDWIPDRILGPNNTHTQRALSISIPMTFIILLRGISIRKCPLKVRPIVLHSKPRVPTTPILRPLSQPAVYNFKICFIERHVGF